VELLRAAHNVQDLPPPSAIVKGAAANEADYEQISEAEAQDLARKDREGVQQNLEREAEKIQSLLRIQTIAGGLLKHVPALKQATTKHSDHPSEITSANEAAVPKGIPKP
jgi:hypothetical protein